MSAREFRLSGIGAFDAIFRDGRRHEGRYIQLIAAPAARIPGRAGFVVGRKVLRRAVDRNRFKRLVREALRRARPQIATMDLIVRLKRPLCGDEITAAASETTALIATCAGLSHPL
jgi:ribonuclease P protein component